MTSEPSLAFTSSERNIAQKRSAPCDGHPVHLRVVAGSIPVCFHAEAGRTGRSARAMVTENNYVLRGTITRASIPQTQRVWLDRYRTWRRFHRGVRRRGLPLLKNLPSYPRCILVAGCQRSGTTMLTRLIAH